VGDDLRTSEHCSLFLKFSLTERVYMDFWTSGFGLTLILLIAVCVLIKFFSDESYRNIHLEKENKDLKRRLGR
jgi:hypothetical protein